jgi:hypothetical protein
MFLKMFRVRRDDFVYSPRNCHKASRVDAARKTRIAVIPSIAHLIQLRFTHVKAALASSGDIDAPGCIAMN